MPVVNVHPKSQLEKRIDDLESRLGVGEFMDIRHTAERFNDYRPHIYDEDTATWVGGNWSSFLYDHVEGYNNIALFVNPAAPDFYFVGYNHVEGYNNKINGATYECVHIEGHGNTFNGSSGSSDTHIEGSENTVNGGYRNHVGGLHNTLTGGTGTFVHGRDNTVTNSSYSAVFGDSNTVNTAHEGAVFGSYNTVSQDYCVVIGSGQTISSNDECYLSVGGTGASQAFTVDGVGNVNATSYNGGGADYAEYFEWADGNPYGEDRCGMLVTLDGDKLIPAHGDDIFGIVSAMPSVVGNSYETYWHGKFAVDVFGRKITAPDGKPLRSPDFDPEMKYIPRSKRPEWAAVGMVGRLVINDNGSCKVGAFVSARRGVGTYCSKNTGIRVLRRIDAKHVEVVIK